MNELNETPDAIVIRGGLPDAPMKQLEIDDEAVTVRLRNSLPFDQRLDETTLMALAMRMSTDALIEASAFLFAVAQSRKPVEEETEEACG